MLANLLTFNKNDPTSRATWELSHSTDHDEIRQAIQQQQGIKLNDWILYPINWQDIDSFELKHQSAHNDFNSALGLAGTDLTDTDFSDPKLADYWNFNHFLEHKAARAKLGI